MHADDSEEIGSGLNGSSPAAGSAGGGGGREADYLVPLQGGQGLSTLGLTPGTRLMLELQQSLEFYICQRLQTSPHLSFELSSATVEVGRRSWRPQPIEAYLSLCDCQGWSSGLHLNGSVFHRPALAK